jgi:uncharacterized oligopeptide transporter (OPT) family protein
MADPDKLRLDVDPTRAAIEDPEARWLREVYRPNEPNLTVRAVIAGILIGAVMCLSNLYVFFKTGWSLGVTLTACILAFGVFQLMHKARLVKQPLGALENNALTTVASGAGYMTAGGNMAAYGALLMVLTPPLLVPHLWDALEGGFLLSREPEEGPGTLQMMIWFAVIAAMGVFVAIPIKRQLINQEGLAFPTGTATAETIRSLHGGSGSGSALRALLIAFAIGVGLKTLVSVAKVIPEHVDVPDGIEIGPITWWFTVGGYSLMHWSIYFKSEVVLLGAGALMSFRTGWSLLLGGILTYAVLAPWLVEHGHLAPIVEGKNNYKYIVQWTLWPGAAILVGAGLTSFALDYKALGRSFSGMGRMFGRSKGPATEEGIAAIEAPGWWFPAGFLFLAPIVIFLMAWIFGIPPWAGVIAAVLAILMGFVASRVTGETDITPTKALGPVTQMTFGALTPGNLTGNIMSANVTGGIGLHAADLLTTLKTGWLLGAKPRHQMYAQLFGVVAGAFFIVPAFSIIIPDPSVLGDSEWPAPSCLVWEGVSRAFANGLDSLSPSIQVAMLVGLGLGIALAVIEKIAPKKIKPFVPSANGLGIAMVIPAANSIIMFLGAAVGEWLNRRQQGANVIPVASGLIAGESLMGIVVALLISAGVVAQ